MLASSSYSPTKFVKTPSGAKPSERVASYANQQIGQLNAGLSNAAISQSPTEVALGIAPKAQNAVQLSAQKRMDSVKTSNQRLTEIARVGSLKRAAAERARAVAPKTSSGINGRVNVGNSRQSGAAYKADGSLSNSRNEILRGASSYIGSAYKLGGTTTRGIDCSGLVKMVYAKLGINFSHYVPTQAGEAQKMGGVRTSVNNLRPGDLVVWGDGSHIAIYAGNGEIIESQLNARSGPGVRRAKLYTNYGSVYGIALRLPGE